MGQNGKTTAFGFCSPASALAALVFGLASDVSAAEEKPLPDPKADSDNYCYQRKAWDDIEKLRRDAPSDPLVIRMYAMRKGLCEMIEEGKITREQGTEIFELKRSRSIIERQQDENKTKWKISA